MAEPWWQRCVVYQIYPRSFKDTTGDGVGDLQGIRQKLDYLKALGVDAIWITPIYDSPQRDHGYDISDYRSIYAEYGTMADFDQLLADAHARGLRIILDIVVNHTSTAHEWFQRSRASASGPYQRYYIWQDGAPGQPPNNWESKFGGSAWAYDAERGQYYLHLFDVTQADLNWEHDAVRASVHDMMRFWLEKGVDGFRLDVINLIAKHQDFPNDATGPQGAKGKQYYTDGPRVHEYLRELNREVFAHYDMMTVGEMSSTSIEQCIQYSNPERQELNMTFSFHHLKVDYPGGEKWVLADPDFVALKRILTAWQVGMNKGLGWNALFWCNHDQPRVVSRYGNDREFRRESAKLLGTALHMMQGTPFVYQGEEIGMTNPHFDQIDDYRDVESLNLFAALTERGEERAAVLRLLRQKSRDNARTPMQWDDTEYAGFSSATPWIMVAPNYREINVADALADEDSVLHHYRKLFALRKQYDVVVYGDYQLLLAEHPAIFAYLRTYGDERLLVVNNFAGRDTVFTLAPELGLGAHASEILLSNYRDSSAQYSDITLRPYESIVYRLSSPG